MAKKGKNACFEVPPMSDEQFAGIPENALRTDSTVVALKPFDNPFSGVVMESDGGVVCYYFTSSDGRKVIDVTDQYNAWIDKQPHIHSVTFEWTEEEL